MVIEIKDSQLFRDQVERAIERLDRVCLLLWALVAAVLILAVVETY